MAKTSSHVSKVKGGSEQHNYRIKELDYVNKELSKDNESWEISSISERLELKKEAYYQTTGQRMQSKANPIREAVVVIDEKTTMEQLKLYSDRCKKRFGIEAIQIHIHKDEGHVKDGKWKKNLHAHIVYDWTNEQGKSAKLKRFDMSEMQTILAECLQMERGKSSNLKHLNAIQYKVQEEEKKLQEMKDLVKRYEPILNAYNANKSLYEKFDRAFWNNAKIKPLIDENEQLKKELAYEVSENKVLQEKLEEAKTKAVDLFKDVQRLKANGTPDEIELRTRKLISDKLNIFMEKNSIPFRFPIVGSVMKSMTVEEYNYKLNPNKLRAPSPDEIKSKSQDQNRGSNIGL